MTDHVTCTCCDGHGILPLSSKLQETLQLLRDIGESTAKALAEQLDVSAQAMHNRLNALEASNLVVWRRIGARKYTWVALRSEESS